MSYVKDSYGLRFAKKRIEVSCNACGIQFTTVIRELYFNKKSGIIAEGFKCPHCGEIYYTLISNNKLRNIMFDVNHARDEYNLYKSQINKTVESYGGLGKVPSFIVDRMSNKANELFNNYLVLRDEAKELSDQVKLEYEREIGE